MQGAAHEVVEVAVVLGAGELEEQVVRFGEDFRAGCAVGEPGRQERALGDVEDERASVG